MFPDRAWSPHWLPNGSASFQPFLVTLCYNHPSHVFLLLAEHYFTNQFPSDGVEGKALKLLFTMCRGERVHSNGQSLLHSSRFWVPQLHHPWIKLDKIEYKSSKLEGWVHYTAPMWHRSIIKWCGMQQWRGCGVQPMAISSAHAPKDGVNWKMDEKPSIWINPRWE